MKERKCKEECKKRIWTSEKIRVIVFTIEKHDAHNLILPRRVFQSEQYGVMLHEHVPCILQLRIERTLAYRVGGRNDSSKTSDKSHVSPNEHTQLHSLHSFQRNLLVQTVLMVGTHE